MTDWRQRYHRIDKVLKFKRHTVRAHIAKEGINMLRIEHLTKTYGDKRAVDDLTLHIEPGQIYGFIGHNGAGKTTTIKACCGIMDFDSGEI